MSRKKIGTLMVVLGFLSLAAAGWLVVQNLQEQIVAEKVSQEVVVHLERAVQETVAYDEPEFPEIPEIPDYQYNPDMEMPEKEIDGHSYIGTIEIFDLELTLPIMSTTTMPNLKIAPCRYSGTAYRQNLIIGAHNYEAHFGKLKNLSYGSRIQVTDMDGNQFLYQVADIEILQPYQVEDLVGGDWPLTLYTCTLGGRTRVVVRCDSLDGF